MELACRRGERVVFRDLTFAVAPGEIAFVTGPNGSGKSSLLRIVAGLLQPLSGCCESGHAVHYCGHAHGLRATLTLRQNMRFWADTIGGNADAASKAVGVDRLLDLPVSALSAGQKQRASLGRLRLAHRSLWLLDEPTGALDRDGADLVSSLLEEHAARDGIAVVATHRPLPVCAATVAVDLE